MIRINLHWRALRDLVRAAGNLGDVTTGMIRDAQRAERDRRAEAERGMVAMGGGW